MFDSNKFWEDTSKWNAAAQALGEEGEQDIATAINSLNVVDTGSLKNKVALKIRKKFGLTQSIGYAMFRYGIFQDNGSGRGWKNGKKLPDNY